MHSKALEALHVAASAIRSMPGIKSCTAENDSDSGEICFTLNNGEEYTLTLSEDE